MWIIIETDHNKIQERKGERRGVGVEAEEKENKKDEVEDEDKKEENKKDDKTEYEDK